MRITGLSGSGLDIDAIVSETMEPYKLQVTNKEKEKALLELKQSMYQDVIKSGQDLYDKYFSLTAKNSLSLSNTYSTVSFSSSNSNAVSAKGLSGALVDNYSASVTQLAANASTTLSSENLTAGQTVTITMGELTETFTLEGSTQAEISKNLNTALSDAGFNISAKYSDFANGGTGGIKLTSSEMGEEVSFTVKVGSGDEVEAVGKNAIVAITNSNGETINYTGTSNQVKFDDVEFTFNSTTVNSSGVDSPVSISGKTEVSGLKDTLISFINDYNTFITDLNTKLTESRNSDYMPLTDDERAEMTDSQIELWEKKVQAGLFRNDSDISRIVNSMKSTMQTISSSTGLNLEAMGITPVTDYGTKNGTFTIDEDKLTSALENNIEGVKELFLSDGSNSSLANGTTNSASGIIASLTDTFKNEFVLPTKSLLIKKAGTKNSSLNSTITAELKKKQEVIDKMNTALTTRENSLYTKYSALETALASLYSQQSSLASMFSS